MDINRLNEFLVLATHLNYSKAANQLYLTQPALSRHINDLEATLGSQLFIRDTHAVYLTPIGQMFYKEAKIIVNHYNQALEMIREASRQKSGKLSIGSLGAAVQPFLSQFVCTFTANHPDIQLNFSCDDVNVLIKQLEDDEIDLAFVTHVNSSSFSDFQSQLISKERLMIALPPSHPLAIQDSVSLKDLSDVPLISFNKHVSPLTCDFHKQLFKKANSTFNVVKDAVNIETAVFYVSMNEGAFILPEHLSHMAKNCVVLPISDKSCYIELNLVWKKNNTNPALPLFCKSFSKFIGA